MPGDHLSERSRWLEVVRGGWGVYLTTLPDHALRLFSDRPPDVRARNVTRILGLRHAAQAMLSGPSPSPSVLAVGVWVDGVHALTALGLALTDPGRRRLAMTDALMAAAWSALGRRDLRRRPARPGGTGWPDTVARTVLPFLPGHPDVPGA